MKRMLPALCVLLAACHSKPDATASSQSTSGAHIEPGREPPPPLPAAYEATFTQPIRVPMPLIEASINGQLPEHDSQPRSSLTRPGASPSLEASLEVWRDPVEARFEGDSLHVDVPLRYAAKFTAKLKNPFGGKWLTVARDADWGTAAEPQRVTLHVRTRVEITPSWELRLHTEVDPPAHGPAPNTKVCTSGAFKLCVTADTLAPEVRRRIDAEIVPRIRDELQKLDRRMESTVNLRVRAEQLWQRAAQPRSLGQYDRYSRIEPQHAALELEGNSEEIVLQPAVAGRVSFYEGKPEAAPAGPLPERVQLSALPSRRVQDARLFALDVF